MSREDILKMMDWHQNETTQLIAIKMADEDDKVEYWIQPGCYKYSWENCAKVIAGKNDLTLVKYLPKILKWLQDLNWPGALTILERLKRFDPFLLKNDLQNAILEAEKTKDNEWLEFLSELTDVNEVNNILDEPIKNIIDKVN